MEENQSRKRRRARTPERNKRRRISKPSEISILKSIFNGFLLCSSYILFDRVIMPFIETTPQAEIIVKNIFSFLTPITIILLSDYLVNMCFANNQGDLIRKFVYNRSIEFIICWYLYKLIVNYDILSSLASTYSFS